MGKGSKELIGNKYSIAVQNCLLMGFLRCWKTLPQWTKIRLKRRFRDLEKGVREKQVEKGLNLFGVLKNKDKSLVHYLLNIKVWENKKLDWGN